jgi:hypothetical protein
VIVVGGTLGGNLARPGLANLPAAGTQVIKDSVVGVR